VCGNTPCTPICVLFSLGGETINGQFILRPLLRFHSRTKKQGKTLSPGAGVPGSEKTNGLWVSFSSLLHSHNRSIISKCFVSLLPLIFIMSLVVAGHHVFVPASSQFTYEVYTEDKQQCMTPLIAIGAVLLYLIVVMLLFCSFHIIRTNQSSDLLPPLLTNHNVRAFVYFAQSLILIPLHFI
jgi:hypothetical protein